MHGPDLSAAHGEAESLEGDGGKPRPEHRREEHLMKRVIEQKISPATHPRPELRFQYLKKKLRAGRQRKSLIEIILDRAIRLNDSLCFKIIDDVNAPRPDNLCAQPELMQGI